MRNKILLFIAFIGFFSLYHNCYADTITIAADSWCPINCDTSDADIGIMVEIAQVIFEKAGHSVEYLVMPWSRAIHEARNGKINGIIGAFKGDAPDFIFPEKELLSISGNSIFVRKNSKWEYENINSLSNFKLAVIQDYDYGEQLNKYIQDNKNIYIISGMNPLKRGIKMISSGRVDAIVECAPVFWYTASKMGLSKKFKWLGQVDSPEKCFIAFSPKNDKSIYYAKTLSEGISSLIANGKYDKILKKYGLKKK